MWCLKLNTHVGTRYLQASDGDVLSDSQWNGVPSPGEIHTQRSGGQKLHVSDSNKHS